MGVKRHVKKEGKKESQNKEIRIQRKKEENE